MPGDGLGCQTIKVIKRKEMVELSRVKNARKKHRFFSFEREVGIPSRGMDLDARL